MVEQMIAPSVARFHNPHSRFSRLTMLAAVAVLERLTHAGLDVYHLELGLEGTGAGEGSGLGKRSATLAQFAVANPQFVTVSGSNLWDALVERAAEIAARLQTTTWTNSVEYPPDATKLVRALERDGYVLRDGGLVRSLPEFVDLPSADDEVHRLLDQFGMATARGHLNQAIQAHSDGQWAAANSQLRTFLECLLDDIAGRCDPEASTNAKSSHGRRALLAATTPAFLYRELNEWADNGTGFVNGLFSRLHPEGSHPGLSSDEDCTFRLHTVLIAARLFLRRLVARR